MPSKEPLRAIIRALQDTHDRAAGFRGEGELASRWTKLNCDCGTVRYGTVLYVNLRVLNNLRFELRGCFEMDSRASSDDAYDANVRLGSVSIRRPVRLHEGLGNFGLGEFG